MPLSPLSRLVSLTVLSVCLGAAPVLADPERSEEAAPSVTLSFDAGQVVTLSASLNAPGEDAAAARRSYFQQVFPIAGDLGLRRGPTLATTQTVIGDFEAQAYSFFSWPTAAAEAILTAHPDWPAIKALRPTAWDELRLYTVILEDGLDLTFRADRSYTVAVAWLNPHAPEDYDRYLDGIEPTLNTMGARFVYKMRDPRYEQNAPTGSAPGQVTIVEWQSSEDLEAFLDSEGFEANYAHLQSGTTRFELHRAELVVAEQ